ncbi:hypothetical protein N2152v2_006095 [Parachlorella kessleri]
MSKRPAEEDVGGLAKIARQQNGQQGNGWQAQDEDEDGQQKPDDELDQMGIPKGWRECPRIGKPIERFVPIKVPLGARYDKVIEPGDRFTPRQAKELADAAVQGLKFQDFPANVGMVIDLTMSRRYYDPQLWGELNVRYCKVGCRGRGEAPSPETVNYLMGLVMSYINENPGGMVLIHCTHGFNRTGFMIVSYLVRALALSVAKGVKRFADSRSPGIYKHYYIRQLFRYYHEGILPGFPFPPQPAWKGGDSPDREDEEAAGEQQGAQGTHIHHEDVLGEEISDAERWEVVTFVVSAVKGYCEWDGRGDPIFPGSQPVSLDRQNIQQLTNIRYWVTWKADGTRYMVAMMRYGTYLVDRKFQIRRVQMRFPQLSRDKSKSPVGPPHHMTLLDGEMVVDEDFDGMKTRRFLIYDLVAQNGQPLVERPWKDRYAMIEDLVVKPRTSERQKIESKHWGFPYQYDKEPFRVRRKEFWPLPRADKLLNTFIPNLCHEADGLIFQPYYAPYEAGTCLDMLKWKFPSMNSVDFQLRIQPGGEPKLLLLHPRGKHRDYELKELEGGKVVFPEHDPAELHNGHIVECAYDHEAGAWTYMRDRRDKKLPNAYRVFEKVFSSIQDNITEDDILEYVKATLTLPQYDRDMGRPQRELEQQQQEQPLQQQQQQPPQQGQVGNQSEPQQPSQPSEQQQQPSQPVQQQDHLQQQQQQQEEETPQQQSPTQL